MTTELPRMVAWYRDTLGLLVSDEVYAGSPDNLVGSFNRLDRGDTYVDHHVFFCVEGNKNGLNHLSFEVQDIDDVMIGHNHLKAKGYAHVWGIGRHQLGSHIFDYWQDPWAACKSTGPIPIRSTHTLRLASSEPTTSMDPGAIPSRRPFSSMPRSDGYGCVSSSLAHKHALKLRDLGMIVQYASEKIPYGIGRERLVGVYLPR